jgi:hypothetical protein
MVVVLLIPMIDRHIVPFLCRTHLAVITLPAVCSAADATAHVRRFRNLAAGPGRSSIDMMGLITERRRRHRSGAGGMAADWRVTALLRAPHRVAGRALRNRRGIVMPGAWSIARSDVLAVKLHCSCVCAGYCVPRHGCCVSCFLKRPNLKKGAAHRGGGGMQFAVASNSKKKSMKMHNRDGQRKKRAS